MDFSSTVHPQKAQMMYKILHSPPFRLTLFRSIQKKAHFTSPSTDFGDMAEPASSAPAPAPRDVDEANNLAAGSSELSSRESHEKAGAADSKKEDDGEEPECGFCKFMKGG